MTYQIYHIMIYDIVDGWLSPLQPPWSAFRELSHGFLKFVCTRSSCKAQFVRVEDGGDVAVSDEFWVIRQAPLLSGVNLLLL
jgi:hypothetical protein